MSVSYIKQRFLDDIKNSIDIEKYKIGTRPWVSEHFNDQSWHHHLDFHLDDSIELSIGDYNSDFENVKIIHKAFKNIPARYLADDKVWAYYAHTKFWDYMQKRWPLKDKIKDPTSYILEHYFKKAGSDRGLLRNGIARLWFIGHMTYNESREDPYELTRLLLSTQEITRTLSERPILMRNKNFRFALLNCMAKDSKPFLKRDGFITLLKNFVRISGIKRLDAFSESELIDLIQNKLIID